MNKIMRIFSICFLVCLLLCITGCKNDDNEKPKEEYTVTYDTKEGTFLDGNAKLTEQYEKNKKVNLINDTPIREGYDFLGWFDQETDEQIVSYFFITKDITLIAKWSTMTYKVTYKAIAGYFVDGSNEKVINVEPNTKFTIGEVPINDKGRLFNGWYDSTTKEYVEEGYVITEDLTVNAKYSTPGEARTVTYILNGGIQDTPIEDTYYEGIRYTLAKPTKEGFEFVGWYDNASFTGEKVNNHDTNVEGDKIYYACWQLTDENYLDSLIDELVTSPVDADLKLPTLYQGVQLQWSSSNISRININGVVNPSHANETVTLGCKVTLNGNTYDIEREVVVKAIKFEEVTNPVAGYFYNTNMKNPSETFLSTFNIAYCAFAYISSNGSVSMNNANSGCTAFLNNVHELRKYGIRCVISIGGNATNFSTACKTNMSKVVTDIVNLITIYNLDGVDIDWECPKDNTDKSNLTTLVQLLRKKLDTLADENSSPYLITAAIPGNNQYQMYDLKKLNNSLDYVNLMSYDMNMAGRTTHCSPLYSGNDSGIYNIPATINNFLKEGLDKNKIIIGAAFYGKSYKITGDVSNSATYPGLNVAAELTTVQYDSGTITYDYIYRMILPNKKYVRYWDNDAKVPYLYNAAENIFITYEDEESVQAKTEYAYKEGIGIMFWAYAEDKDNILTNAICEKMYELRNQ